MEIFCRDNLLKTSAVILTVSSVRNQVHVLQKQKELEWQSTCVWYCFCWQRLYLILSHELKRDNVCNVDAGPGQPQLTETKLVQPPVNLSPGKKLKGNGVNKGPGGRFNKFLLKNAWNYVFNGKYFCVLRQTHCMQMHVCVLKELLRRCYRFDKFTVATLLSF